MTGVQRFSEAADIVILRLDLVAGRCLQVNCSADTLKVEVKGHQLQPVVEGKLFEKVDVDAFDWHLEGSGDKRVLILDLEKVMGGLDWPDLLKR